MLKWKGALQIRKTRIKALFQHKHLLVAITISSLTVIMDKNQTTKISFYF